MSDLFVTRFMRAPQRNSGGWNHMVAAVTLAWRTHATRQALPELSDHLLADIGLSHSAALAEAARLPWDTHAMRRRRRGRGLWSVIQRRLEWIRMRRLFTDARLRTVFWGG